MALDRQDIEKTDFPVGRRGYDPKAVDAHLRSVADKVDSEQRNATPPPSETLAGAASEQVRQIVAAAETSAAEITRKADQEGREHVARVSEAARAMIERVDALESELGSFVERLRGDGNRLTADLSALEGNMGELRRAASAATEPEPSKPAADGAAREQAPSRPAPTTPAPAREAAGDPPIESEATEREEEAEADAYDDVTAHAVDAVPDEEEPEVATGTRKNVPAAVPAGGDDTEGARLIALNMALNGSPRDEADRYLAENFELDNREGLLDEVYARVGS